MIPPPEVAAALGIAPQVPAIERRRLMSVDGQPFEVTTSWWPTPVGRRTALAEPGRIKGGAVTLLAQLGYTVHRSVEDLWADGAADDDAGLLGIAAGSPVLVLFRTAFDSRGLPFQADVMTRRAGARQRYQLTTN